MKLRMLDSGLGGRPARQCASSYPVNVLAVDAGCFGFWETPDDQSTIRYAVITCSYTDQIASRPSFPGNTARPSIEPGIAYRLPKTLSALQKRFFNDVIWPDFAAIKVGGKGFLRWEFIVPNEPFVAAALGVTATLANHKEARPPRIEQELESAQMDKLGTGVAQPEYSDL